jgi:hypothetical protein
VGSIGSGYCASRVRPAIEFGHEWEEPIVATGILAHA